MDASLESSPVVDSANGTPSGRGGGEPVPCHVRFHSGAIQREGRAGDFHLQEVNPLIATLLLHNQCPAWAICPPQNDRTATGGLSQHLKPSPLSSSEVTALHLELMTTLVYLDENGAHLPSSSSRTTGQNRANQPAQSEEKEYGVSQHKGGEHSLGCFQKLNGTEATK